MSAEQIEKFTVRLCKSPNGQYDHIKIHSDNKFSVSNIHLAAKEIEIIDERPEMACAPAPTERPEQDNGLDYSARDATATDPPPAGVDWSDERPEKTDGGELIVSDRFRHLVRKTVTDSQKILDELEKTDGDPV